MDHVNAFTVKNMDQPEITNLAEQFVVQYYSVMRFSPANLHRFYVDRSSMIFESYPIYGQQQIHEKFMELELQNSRVAVLQLDALKASDSSVVIQVAGEMSLNNREFRRFMQTFILCEKGSRDLYVLNDIFRFQDKTFGDVDEKILKEPVSKPVPVENTVSHLLQPEMNRNIKPTSNGIDHAQNLDRNSPMKVDQIAQEHSALHNMHQIQQHPKPQVSQNHQIIRPVEQAPAQPVTEPNQAVPNESKSWAQMASTNVKSGYNRFTAPQENKTDVPAGNRNQERFSQKPNMRNRQERDTMNDNRFMNAAGGDNGSKMNSGRSADERGGRRGFRGGANSRGGRGAHDAGGVRRN